MKFPHEPPVLTYNAIFVTYWCSFVAMPWCNFFKNLDLILKYDVGLVLYLIIKNDLNAPCYFVAIAWIEKLLTLKKIKSKNYLH